MKEQEAKIKAKYGPFKKPCGGSALLQKRFLQKGVSNGLIVCIYTVKPVFVVTSLNSHLP